MDKEFLREIKHDKITPKSDKKLNEDGFFELDDEKRESLNQFILREIIIN